MDNLIEVGCIATPEGRAYWCEWNVETIARFWSNWKASLPADKLKLFQQRGCLGGVVKIHMLESAYRAIPATSDSAALFQTEAR